MLSIIISSANNLYLKQISENIEITIGAPYEIIAVNNSSGEKGICQIYNESAARAKYDILCFLHEDIIIKTNNWGYTLSSIFEQHPEIGLVGVAGGAYKTLAPSSWEGIGINNDYINLIQSFKYQNTPNKISYRNPQNSKLAQVACIDGVFMCTTKKVFSECKFDESTFKGFHAYDIDFSLNVGQKYKVVVTYDLLLNHLSEGRYDVSWMKDNIKLHKKWNGLLPVNIEGFNFKQQMQVEKVTFKLFIKQLIQLDMPVSIAYKILWYNNRFRKLFSVLFWKLNYYILKMRISRGNKI